jgi:arginase
VLWLDAHADFNTNVLTPSGNIHGMPVACLCGYGPKELIEIGGTVPAISPKMIRQIGIRSVDAGREALRARAGLEVFDMRYIDEMGMRHTMELALATHRRQHPPARELRRRLSRPRHRARRRHHLPTYREAQLCMEMIADTGRLASLLNPALDVRKTASDRGRPDRELFGKSTLMRG